MLDKHPETAAGGTARDAAIGAAAYASAERDLAERLKVIQNPGLLPTVFGGMPIVPTPAARAPGQNL
jgi:hypothetical protein